MISKIPPKNLNDYDPHITLQKAKFIATLLTLHIQISHYCLLKNYYLLRDSRVSQNTFSSSVWKMLITPLI